MAKIQCKMCGGLNDLPDGATSGECPYCGTLTTFPKIADEQTEHLYTRAEHFRQRNDFDKAVAAYESILNRNSEDPEAYWGLLISRYGIEYVEDPATHERIPTCHRVQFDSILADSDYLNALKYASGPDRDIYEKEANRIAEIQKGILRISAQEKPYDVFICYKETTDGGTRTKDSTLAQEIYYQLTNQGLKVFFARITLEDKIGQQYEPYIFAALNSAKVMLVIGSKKEYFEAVWVKNEWSRYLALKKKDRSRLLIPCYKDMDPYDIPEELSMFQCQDMGKIGFIQDLIRGIMKVVNVGKPEATPAAASASGSTGNTKIMKRISILMEQQDWNKAREICDTCLNTDPENPDLYLMLCLIAHKKSSEKELQEAGADLSADTNFEIALKCASPERRKQLETIRANAVENLLGSYLRTTMDRKKVSSVADLAHLPQPLSQDEFFQNAIRVAPPERKEELIRIQESQTDYFLQECMTACDASNEIELAACPISLAKESHFQTALRCASPERRTALEKILLDQTECCLQRCMDKRHVSSLDMLAQSTLPLMNDPDFVMTFECADTTMKSVLRSIVSRQSEFLNKRRKKRKETTHVALWVIPILVLFLVVFLCLLIIFLRSAK